MTKREIAKLPEEEQAFIYSYGLEKLPYEDIKWLEEHFNYAVYKGWL